MSTLYIVRAQPNPPGKDSVRRGYATAEQLNREWLEFEARNGDRSLAGDVVAQLTLSDICSVTGQDSLIKFGGGVLLQGHRLQLHTGSGVNQLIGNVFHVYLGRNWFVWNNRCGDRATIRFQETVLDSAGYRPNPPEGILIRVPGTDRLEPAGQAAAAWR